MNLIRNISRWIVFSILLLECACQPVIPAAFQKVESTNTIMQTPVDLAIIPQSAATATVVGAVETNCALVLSEPPMGWNLPGSLIIGNDRFDVNSGEFLGTVYPNASYVRTSPDGKWITAIVEIAYHAKYDIVTRPVNALEPEYRFSYEGEYFTIQWVNSQTLLLRIYNQAIADGYQLVLFSPFTNEYQLLPTTYPDLQEDENVEIQVSPDQKHLIYVAYEHNPNTPWFLSNVLWSLETKKQVKVFDQAATGYVRWSPNGKYLAFNEWEMGASKLVPLRLVVTDGLGEEFASYADPDGIVDYAWSPDSKKVGFTYHNSVGQRDDRFLGFWDIETGMVIKSCLPVDACGKLLWSSDSRYLASGSENACIRFSDNHDKKQTLVFWNIEQQWAVKKVFPSTGEVEWVP